MLTAHQAERLIRFADLHDVGMICFDGEAVTIASFAVDTNLPEGDERRLVLEFDRCTTLAAMRDALGY
jgi:hypothetical protein